MGLTGEFLKIINAVYYWRVITLMPDAKRSWVSHATRSQREMRRTWRDERQIEMIKRKTSGGDGRLTGGVWTKDRASIFLHFLIMKPFKDLLMARLTGSVNILFSFFLLSSESHSALHQEISHFLLLKQTGEGELRCPTPATEPTHSVCEEEGSQSAKSRLSISLWQQKKATSRSPHDSIQSWPGLSGVGQRGAASSAADRDHCAVDAHSACVFFMQP